MGQPVSVMTMPELWSSAGCRDESCRCIPICLTSGIHQGDFCLAKWTIAMRESFASVCFKVCFLCSSIYRKMGCTRYSGTDLKGPALKGGDKDCNPGDTTQWGGRAPERCLKRKWRKGTSVNTWALGQSELPTSFVDLS